jgi:hypothetical protein
MSRPGREVCESPFLPPAPKGEAFEHPAMINNTWLAFWGMGLIAGLIIGIDLPEELRASIGNINFIS